MAGIKIKVESSTILEVIIAMILIVIVFGIAMMIYTNVIRFAPSQKELKARAILGKVMTNLSAPLGDGDVVTKIGDFKIEQEIKSYPQNSRLKLVILRAFDNNQQKIAQVQKVMPAK